MKLLYVALKYDYADKKRGLSYEHNNFYSTLSRMYKDSIIYFPVDEKIEEFGRKGMNKELVRVAEKEKPDVMFTTLYTNEIHPKTIKHITKKTKTKTINWFCDDQWRFESFSRYWAPFFDWVTTTDPKAVAKYQKIGYKNVIKSTWAANTGVYHPTKSKDQYEVSFVGAAHGGRKQDVETLKKAGINVQAFGSGWPAGRVSQEKMVEIFGNSKINLNFTEASTSKKNFKTFIKTLTKVFLRRGINNTYHFFPISVILRNIFNFKLPKSIPQIKGRNFEVPACGGFLLTQEAENLYDHYEYGKEIVIWKDIPDLVEKIKYYLQHEGERVNIAKAGYARTLQNHTWEKRFTEIMQKLLSYEK